MNWGDDPGEKNLTTGMHRVCAAQETVECILSQKHRFGITRVANVTGLDRIGVPVALAIRPNSRSVAVSQGKGLSLDHAKASALMESVEIWHAERIETPLFFSSYADLRQPVIDVSRLPEATGAAFLDTTRMLWVEGFDLISQSPMLVPFEMIHADYTDHARPGQGCVPASTNGLASGNHPLEAICHAICEVIERDALSVWHHAHLNGQPLRRVPLATIDSEDCQSVLQRFDAADLDCAIWDVTTDTQIASFMAVIVERGAGVNHLGLGSGTHLDRGIALRRALTEAAQTRLNYISGSRDDLFADEYAKAGMASKSAAFTAMIDGASIDQPFDEVPTQLNQTLKGDLDTLLDNLRAVGIEQVVGVDLTKADIGIPVMRVVIPGLEAPHDDTTYIPGPRAQSGGIA